MQCPQKPEGGIISLVLESLVPIPKVLRRLHKFTRKYIREHMKFGGNGSDEDREELGREKIKGRVDQNIIYI